MPTAPRTLRTKKLVDPKIQMSLVWPIAGVSALAMMLQFLFLGARLSDAMVKAEINGASAADAVPRLLLEVFAVSVLVLVPVVTLIGIALTFRIAGPLHRFRLYLRAILRNEQAEPCRIREGDHLQDFCDLLNEATAPLLVSNDAASPSADRKAA